MFDIVEHIIPAQFLREHPRATANSETARLSLVVKQYTPSTPADASFQRVTIIGAHGNGCPKELYEPLWEDLNIFLLEHKIAIQNVWIADAVHQGASGLLNEENLGSEASFFDHSRDILCMINHFQSQMTLPLIGVGHSMGATHLIQASLQHNRLFHALVLIEPVLYDTPQEHVKFGPAYLAATRRDHWPSHAEFVAHARKSKAYRAWDPRALQRWFEYGVRPSSSSSSSPPSSESDPKGNNKGVTLRTTKHQEALALARPNYISPFPRLHPQSTLWTKYPLTKLDDMALEHASDPFLNMEPVVIFHNLPFLRPSALYMFGEQSVFLKGDGMRTRAVERTGNGVFGSGGVVKGRVRQVEIEQGSHMAPMEQPGPIAREVSGWVARAVRVWNEERRTVALEWRGKQGEARRRMDGEFLGRLGVKEAKEKGSKL